MPPPALVVEVVSAGKAHQDRDDRYQQAEYAARGIPEYSIVDPIQAKVTVLTWVEGLYEKTVFEGQNPIISQLFPQFKRTVVNYPSQSREGFLPNK